MKSLKQFLFLLSALLPLVGCARTDILNALIPHDGYILHKDIAYGDNPRQHLDMYVPDKVYAPAGVVLFFYGGAWRNGNKDHYRFVGQAFASKGYVAVIADYRLYPEVVFPDFVLDGARALVWVHEHIGDYGGDPEKIFLAGHSAGAHIAAMLSVNESYVKAAGGQRAWIKGMVGLAGPYDFLPIIDPDVQVVFGKIGDVASQPITYVGEGAPCMFLATGAEDTEVGPHNTKNMASKLRQFHDNVTEKIYPGVAHIGIILALADGFRGKAPVLDDIDAFIRACH